MELKANVPLEDALTISGCGKYTYLIVILAGLVDFAAYSGIQLMSMVIPAAGCDLGLTTYQKGVLNSMIYIGMIFSSHIWGFLADSYGRRTVMRVGAFGLILVYIISSFAPNAGALYACCFVTGLLLAAIFTPIYVYVSECCPQMFRSKSILIVCAISSLSSVYLPAAAWVIIPLEIQLPIFNTGIVFTSWRLYIALLSVPLLWAYLILLILPQTPKYTLGKGMQKETMKMLRKIYAKNHNKPEEDYPVLSVCLDSSDEMSEVNEDKSKPFIHFFKTIFFQTKMIFSRPLLKYTAISCVLNVGVIGVFNTILLWFPELVNRLMFYSRIHGTETASFCEVMTSTIPSLDSGNTSACTIEEDVYIINIANGLLQSVSYYLFSFIAVRVESKHLLVGLSALSVVSCLTVIFTPNIILIIIAEAVLLIFLLILFPVYISVIVDYFPTSLRTNATSIIMLCGRISAVAGTQIVGALYDTYCELAYPGITVILIGLAILFLILPKKR